MNEKTLDEKIHLIWQKVLELSARFQAAPHHPEAPFSMTTKLIDENGFEWMITIRAGASIELARQTWHVASEITKKLKESGKGFPVVGQGYKALPAREPQAAPAPPTSMKPEQPEGNYERLLVDTISKHIQDGTEYYKVQAGPYRKWGITCWPEVMEQLKEYINLDNMKPGQRYDVKGLNITALVLKEEDKLKKVIGFEVGA